MSRGVDKFVVVEVMNNLIVDKFINIKVMNTVMLTTQSRLKL